MTSGLTQAGRTIVVVGLVLVVAGAAIWGLGRLGFRGLPGDITIQTRGMKIYIPIVTCIVLSIVLSIIVWLARTLGR